MSHTLSRSDFLRGRIEAQPLPLRPPWALPETAFVAACTRCGDCIRACPERILGDGTGGFPQVSFANAGCTFCGDCVDVCVPTALGRRGRATPWTAAAAITDSCLSRRGVACRVCGDQCAIAAISFRLAVGGVADPVIDAAACTGCGDCVAPCPADAVVVASRAFSGLMQGAAS